MLELKNLSKFYYSKGIVSSGISKINLKFEMGEFIAITGESGSGKSTLLNVISGLDSYEEGEMYIKGEETSHYTETDFEKYRKQYISNIYQSFNLINSYTVYQNIELVLLLNGYKKRQVKQKILELIKKVDLYKFKNTKVSKLSGGQKQRVAIARALAKETPIIIADEPTGNLDSESAKSVIKLLSEISKDKLVIVVTHNYEQIEEYATRKIKMHDGRVLEDKKIKDCTYNKANINKEFKNINFCNKIRLGTRNTFNVLSKFVLLFIVFIFITSSVILTYSSNKESIDTTQLLGYNYCFPYINPNRIVLKKQDGSAFTQEDYNKINVLENIEYIHKNDALLDSYTELSDDNLFFGVQCFNINNFTGDVDFGRMPQNKDEIIFVRYNLGFGYDLEPENVLDKTFKLYGISVKVVGVKLTNANSLEDIRDKVYVQEGLMNELQINHDIDFSDLKILILDKYYKNGIDYIVKPNSNVVRGCAYVHEDLSYLNNGKSIINKNIQINVENIYYKDSVNLKISKTFNKNNFKKLLGIKEYEENLRTIFINTDDYCNLYDNGIYQVSVFVKEINNINNTNTELINMGYKTLLIKDTIVQYSDTEIIELFSEIFVILEIVAIFFISYFVIRIILKSRNIYFATIRMLGAEPKVIRKLLIIELIIIANLAYLLFIAVLILQNKGLINIESLKTVISYLKISDYALLYSILMIISLVISLRYSKNIFKKSSIKTYNEEV